MKTLRFVVVICLCFTFSCHPFSRFWPDKLDHQEALSDAKLAPNAKIEILVDNWGVPHIYADSEEELVYGLGFMHGRDRRFQVLAIKYAANGRLSEIFGERTLELDRMLRMLSYKIDEQFRSLSERDKGLMIHYANGVNAGIKKAGRTIEETILRAELEPFKPIDSLLIGRLQAWELSGNYLDELARFRMIKSGTMSDGASAVLFTPVSTAQVPVVDKVDPRPPVARETKQSRLSLYEKNGLLHDVRNDDSSKAVKIPDLFIEAEGIGSNSYVIAGKYTESGKPVLCNDPHLEHRAPSVFYMAHLEHAGVSVTGATFPGLPAVLIGRGRNVAWGMTASYADTQDLVRLKIDPTNASTYLVDGQSLSLNTTEQHFVYGKKPDEVLVEKWHSSIFGLVLPPVFTPLKDEGEQFALQWGGFDPSSINNSPISGFWDLAKASNVSDASNAIDKFSFAGISVILAFNDGTIAYRLAALLPPTRDRNELYQPRDGSSLRAIWNDYLPMSKRPSQTNPQKGYIIAANQRLVTDDDPALLSAGVNSGSWSRAARIDNRIEHLIANAKSGKVSANALLAIQQDTVAPEAQSVAPVFAAHCPRAMPGVKAQLSEDFCDALQQFDGDFKASSLGAAPYVYMLNAFRSTFLREDFDETVTKQAESRLFSQLLLTQSLTKESAKTKALVQKAAPIALAQLVKDLGSDKESWAWGKHHRLKSKGALFAAPIIGGLFATKERAQGGYAHAPRAEAGTPVTRGAVMRMLVDMQEPFARMVLDTGNGGTPGHKHFEDMSERWNVGDPIAVLTNKEKISSEAEEHFWINGAKPQST